MFVELFGEKKGVCGIAILGGIAFCGRLTTLFCQPHSPNLIEDYDFLSDMARKDGLT